MSAPVGLRFGPIALRVEAPGLHPLLAPYLADVAADARRVVVAVAAALPPETPAATAEVGFALVAHPDHDAVTLRGDPARPTPWLAAFCEIVARDAPTRGALLIHAGAVTVAGGVALLVAAPGVGKTTAVRAAGARAFASNAVLVDGAAAGALVRAMPFTREPAPELESTAALPLAALAYVRRAEAPTVEWIKGSAATMLLMPHVTRPRGDDPHARARTLLALALGGAAPALRLGLPWGPGYLGALDAALHPTTIPV
ncbi:MAG: hypothetical protein JWM10_1601 [Myxococcaceae bacterium]|nr:hypothetical protein [Myxococcaceae bacterium]